MSNQRWSPQARRWLANRQKELYEQLGERAGIGRDATAAFLRFSAAPMPASWIAADKFEGAFASDWSAAPGWGDHQGAIDAFLATRERIELPTPYEDENRYPMLLEMATQLQQTLQDVVPRLAVTPLLGSLPSGEINARSMLLGETGEYLVLFEHGLFDFAFNLAKVLSLVFPHLVPDGTSARFATAPDPAAAIDATPAILDAFVGTVAAYVVHGNPRSVAKFDVPPANLAGASVLVRAMELFVLGHEYAHIVLGHLLRTATSQPPGEHAEIEWSWQQEFDADQFGWSMANRTLGLPWPLGYWGAEAFFNGMDVLDRALAILGGVPLEQVQRSATHPPMPARRDRLRADLPDIAVNEDAPAALALGAAVERAFDELWQRSLPRWQRMRDDGVRPSALWT